MIHAFSGSIYLLFIASRHGSMQRVQEHVDLAEHILDQSHDSAVPLCGFDLAGGEGAKRAEEMRQVLMPMLEKCLHMTIHAGETQNVQSIWEAVYHLSAERIGHGLTLKQNPALLDKFRDRDIAIEMCPSSNMQIVGFQDAFLPCTSNLPVYPLKEYLDQGLRVTVNTDNPGISRTDMTNELHRAARMSPEGLSLWEVCSLVRNGFRSAFAPRDVRTRLLRQDEEEVIDIIQQGIWP
jgi:adenosine deaminase